VVNGEVVTRADVDNRTRLFALSTGLPIEPQVLARLRPQITRQLIDERLRMQEIQRRRIIVPDEDVAAAIGDIEQRNGLPKGSLTQKLAREDVALTTLIQQIRAQLGWTRVLRQVLGPRSRISEADIAARQAILNSQKGQPEYQVGEIFVPVEDPFHAAEAQKFAETVIGELRAGAPFSVVAAEFSQSSTALQGGQLGWVLADQLDPQVAALVGQMPVGAISNPVRVAGGFDIINLQGKRTVGSEMATELNVRQAFQPFTTPLNPQAPTDQQRKILADMQQLSREATSCDAIEAANKRFGEVRPGNPGPIRADRLAPQMRALMTSLKVGVPSKAIVTPEGVIVVMLCSSAEKNFAEMSHDDIGNQLLQERVELASRQLEQQLRRRALIDHRSS
jgi:peptidyl-prolyl cis-trans isomerase SurA